MNKDNNKTLKVGNFFDHYAEEFSSIYKEDEKKRSSFDMLMDKIFRKDIEDRFNTTLDLVSKDSIKNVLDIGCGPGHFVVKFLELGKDVTALDISSNMLDITKGRASLIETDSKFESILDDYSAHIFDQKFDATCVMGFFDYIEHPVPVLKKLLEDTEKEIYISFPDDKGILAIQRRIRYYLRSCPLYLYSQSYIEDCLKEAGCFEMAEIKKTDRNYFVVIRK